MIVPCEGGGNNLTCEALTFKDLRLEHLQAMAQRLGFSDLKEGELKRLYDSLVFFVWDYGWSNQGPRTPPPQRTLLTTPQK